MTSAAGRVRGRVVRLVPLAGIALALGLSADGEAGPAASRAAVDQTFADAVGDSTGRLDITSVRVSSQGDRLDVRVTTREQTINIIEAIFITIDTNFDGRSDFGFLFRGGGSGTLWYLRYPTSQPSYDPAPATYGGTSGQDFGITFNLRLGPLGNPEKIKLFAGTKESTASGRWDSAPNSGWFDYVIRQATPPQQPPTTKRSQDFVARGGTMDPDPPQAGRPVVVRTRFVFRASGRTVQTGRLTCSGTVGSQRIPGSGPSLNSRRHACEFQLPASAAGKLFAGRVSLAVGGRTRSVRMSKTVISTRFLRLKDIRTQPIVPSADKRFAATFAVELVRGQAAVPVSTGEVDCRATAGGKRVSVYFNGFFRESGSPRATCSWNRIPASARGSTFVGTVTVRSGGLTATETIRYRVR